MPLLLMLLALQAEQDPPASVRSPPAGIPTNFGIGPELQYWLPRFRGHLGVNGTTTRGSDLRLVGDLNLSDEPAIPMLGGGEIEFVIDRSGNGTSSVILSAEHWGHGWGGDETLSGAESVGNQSFAAGTRVESRFHLSEVTLDASISRQEQAFRGGLTLSLRAESASLHMDSPSVHADDALPNLFWGGGVFLDLIPAPHVFVGASVKGFTDNGASGGADLRGYGGAEWGPIRLEGGYRYMDTRIHLASKHLDYLLYGPYVALSVILRF